MLNQQIRRRFSNDIIFLIPMLIKLNSSSQKHDKT